MFSNDAISRIGNSVRAINMDPATIIGSKYLFLSRASTLEQSFIPGRMYFIQISIPLVPRQAFWWRKTSEFSWHLHLCYFEG